VGISRSNSEVQNLLKRGAKCFVIHGRKFWPVVAKQEEIPVFEKQEKPVVEKPTPSVKPKIPKPALPIKSSVDAWESILDDIAEDCKTVFLARGGVGTKPWFMRWSTQRQKILDSLIGMRVIGLTGFRDSIDSELSDRELLKSAGKMLCRLLDMRTSVFHSPRAWFSKAKDGPFWFHGLPILTRAKCNNLVSDMNAVDLYNQFVVRVLHKPAEKVVELVPSTDGHLGFDLYPISEIFSFANQHKMPFESLLRLLWLREVDHCERFGGIPSYLACKLSRHLLRTTPAEIKRALANNGTSEFLTILQVPGVPYLPKKLRYGLDCRNIVVPTLGRLTAITDGGQAILEDEKGRVSAEGNQLPTLEVVKGWGKGIQIWATEENFKELGKFWYNPPPKCPWEWYKKWGDKAYLESGKAIHPDPKFRPDVVWLEQSGITIEEWAKQNAVG